MRFNTPLRYPGGKGKLAGFIKKTIDINGMGDIHYAEPYAGGAGLALKLLFEGYASHLYLNDINKAVYAFWYSTLYHTDELCALISSVSVNMDEWHKQKMIMNNHLNENDLLKLGFATFFLNRTNRSGILKGGVIGGKNQDGKWKLDARFNKEDLIKRIMLISQKRNHISIYNLDAKKFIDDVIVDLPSNSLTYLDPPYYIKGQGLYENHYKHNDHSDISGKILNDIKTPWIVSYDSVPEIMSLYSQKNKINYGISYSAQNKYQGSEVMFFSDNIKLPSEEIISCFLK